MLEWGSRTRWGSSGNLLAPTSVKTIEFAASLVMTFVKLFPLLSVLLAAVVMFDHGVVDAQSIGFRWTSSGSVLPASQWASAVDAPDGSVYYIGGCSDVACAGVVSTVTRFFPDTQIVNEVPSEALPTGGVAGPFAAVSVAPSATAGRSVFVFRSCSLCFATTSSHGQTTFYPNRSSAASNQAETFDASSYFREVWELPFPSQSSAHSDSSASSSGFPAPPVLVGRIPNDPGALRCNASCVAQGSLVYIIGGVSLTTGDEVMGIDVVSLSQPGSATVMAYQSNVSSLPSELSMLRAASPITHGNVNVMGTSFVCGFGGAAGFTGVASNNEAVFISTVCWDFAYPSPEPTASVPVSVVAWYSPLRPLMAPWSSTGQYTLLYANVSLANGLTNPNVAVLLPFASQVLCTGGFLLVAIDFVFESVEPREGKVVLQRESELYVTPGNFVQVVMSGTQAYSGSAVLGEPLLSSAGTEWNLYSLGGTASRVAVSNAIQIGATSIGLPAPLQVIVSAGWNAERGLFDNTTYSQADIGPTLNILVGNNVTIRLTDFSAGVQLMLSSYADCSTPLHRTAVTVLQSTDATFPIVGASAAEIFICLSDGVRVLVSPESPLVTTFYFSALNKAAPMRSHEPPTTTASPNPTASPPATTTTTATPHPTVVTSTVAPAPTPPVTESPSTTTSAPSSVPAATSWLGLPRWAAFTGVGLVAFVVAVTSAFVIYRCCCGDRPCWGASRLRVVTQRDAIALENITNSNKYAVIRRLGSGGNGEVFLVRRRKDGELCAIKHVRCRGSKSRDDLFRESDVLGRLKGHPNLVEILEMSLHEVYVDRDEDPFEENHNGQTGTVGGGTWSYSNTADIMASNMLSTQSGPRHTKRDITPVMGEPIATTGPLGSDRLFAINEGLGSTAAVHVRTASTASSHPEVEVDTDDEESPNHGSSAAPQKEKRYRRRTSRVQQVPQDAAAGNDLLGSSKQRLLPSSSTASLHASQRRMAIPAASSRDEGGYDSEACLLHGGGDRREGWTEQDAAAHRQRRHKVRFQCIVMKYFKRGDLASYLERNAAILSTQPPSLGDRRGSLFGSLLNRQRSKSQDDATLPHVATPQKQRFAAECDEVTDIDSVASRSRLGFHNLSERSGDCDGSGISGDVVTTPAEVADNGNEEERHGSSERDASVSPQRLARCESEGNMSQSSFRSHRSNGTAATAPAAAPPLLVREDIVASIVYQVAALLRYLHSRKPNRIVHCDIKPENILVADTIHPQYLALLGGQAASNYVAANQQQGRSSSRLGIGERRAEQSHSAAAASNYGAAAAGSLPPTPSSVASRRTVGRSTALLSLRGADASPSTVFGSQRSVAHTATSGLGWQRFVPLMVASGGATAAAQVVTTAVGELVSSALDGSFLPVVVSDVGQAMEIPSDTRLASELQLTQCTMPYVAPECVASGLRRVSPAIDIWALGCVVYSICTGRLKHTDVVVMFEEVRNPTFAEDLKFELQEYHGYSPALVALILGMLQPDPALRPTAADITDKWIALVPIINPTSPLSHVLKLQFTTPQTSQPSSRCNRTHGDGPVPPEAK